MKTQSCPGTVRAFGSTTQKQTRRRRLDRQRRVRTRVRPLSTALSWLTACLVTLCSSADGALPIFESNTPTGFSPSDSTAQDRFVEGDPVMVRADLNQAATPTNPVYGHFHRLETAQQTESNDVDGVQTDVAVSADGTIHMAWISSEVVLPVTTPVYYVRYLRTNSSLEPVSVSGSLRFDILTINGGGGSFSTVDLEVDSKGNPRVVYAFNEGADGNTAASVTEPDNVYFNYSIDGGASWLPQNTAVVVNDTATVGEARSAAFPRMAIDQRDNIYITYVRGSSAGGALATDDVMVTKVDQETSPFTMEMVGSTGNASSAGGVRIARDDERQTGPDIAVGTGDVLHVIYFHEEAVAADSDIEHKTLLADMWDQADASGWDQSVAGADVDDFDPSPVLNTALDTDVSFYFPTVVVDKQSTPDRIYAIYKYGDTSFETIFFNDYTYDNAIGGSAGWSTGTASPVWGTATTGIFKSGSPFWNIELDWTVTERVSAVVDDRLPDRGEIHIAFSAGFSESAAPLGVHDLYYGFYNGASWTLPETVADADDGVTEGIPAGDAFLSSPAIAKRSGDPNVALAFAAASAEGLGVDDVTDVNGHAFFKVLGRAVTSEDQSIPVGGFQYDLEYLPSFPHDVTGSVADSNHVVYVHAADNVSGLGLGAAGNDSDAFLAGNWETVSTSLADDNKVFEGRINEDASTTREWGDDDDKIGLLVKVNVLSSNSSTNIQEIINSTASAAGTGFGTRSIRVNDDPSTFVLVSDFFMLGADIDIIDSNTAPTVSVTEPNGVGDTASTAYVIKYDLTDPDDEFAPAASTDSLEAALYFSEHSDLATVQDIRIFGTLIVDENDNSGVFPSGTNDFKEGQNQAYTWDDPPAALDAVLFASIEKVPNGDYFIYLVADDQKNPPVFARSPGALTILHKPIVKHVDPSAGLDTVDTGVRSGELANPYDLDFLVRDFDRQGETEVQLFFSSVSGLSSVKITGTYPNQKFTLGKSSPGFATAIEQSDTLTSADTEFSWDLTDSVFVSGDSSIVAEGSYFIYVVASDSVNISVGQSDGTLIVKHSPSFVFYEPPVDTHREIDTGSQPTYTIQWQKGPGDQDFDEDGTIDLYFTTDNPATINYEDFPDSLLKDSDTRIVVKGLKEDSDNTDDMYLWDLRNPPNDVPRGGRKIWIYAIIGDSSGNNAVSLGGALTMSHTPYIIMLSADLSPLAFDKNDVLRISWDDYLVDDGSGTDDAYIRLYAEPSTSNLATFDDLETLADFIINSSDGTAANLIPIREDSVNFFDWNTKLFGVASTNYDIYAAINPDPTFSGGDTNNQISRSFPTSPLMMGAAGTIPDVSLNPTDLQISIGDTATFDVMVQYTQPLNLVLINLKVNSTDFQVLDQDSTQIGRQPFIDLDNVFSGTTPIENTFDSGALELRFVKSSFTGELVGTPTEPEALARFQLVARNTLGSMPSLIFADGSTGTVLGRVGDPDPLHSNNGLVAPDPDLTRGRRGRISATVELEGRTVPPASNDHSTFLEIHLRLAGSTIDIDDQNFIDYNDDILSTSMIEVSTAVSGSLLLESVPAGRYVLTVKDTSHVSGRTDTITVRNGDLLTLDGSGSAFFGSDLRGDPTALLPSGGRELIAGDVSGDNEINEDDVNLIIASWGTNSSLPFFKQADINNDEEVGAADLTVTTSNFGNSVGFGAPPVFKPTGDNQVTGRSKPPAVARSPLEKPVPRGDNSDAVLDLRPLFAPGWRPRPGAELGFEIVARELDDLAGYEFEVKFDGRTLELIPDRTEAGNAFGPNPYGAVFESRAEDGVLRIISSRVGKEWTAQGDASLARIWFKVFDEEMHEAVELGEGVLLNPRYQPARVNWASAFSEHVLPSAPGLDQNYPNPFNPSTAISLALPREQSVRLEIYNVLGQRIRTLMSGPMDPGFHTIVWNGRDDAGRAAAAGLYITLMQTRDFRQARKMLLVK